MPADAPLTALNLHTRRVSGINKDTWILGRSQRHQVLSQLPSKSHASINDDLSHICARLCDRGMRRILVVDFSPPNAPFAVVRVIVPGLESWAINRGRVGKRALKFWQTNA